MGDVTNLNKARKDRARAAKRQAGDANAVKHGRSKAERDLQKAQAQKAARDLDGHRKA